MHYAASLVAVLGLSATSFAAPTVSAPEVSAIPSSAIPASREAPNLASPFSNANGGVPTAKGIDSIAERQLSSVEGLTDVATPLTSPVTSLLGDLPTKRDVIAITDVVTTLSTLKTTIVSDVVSIHTLIQSVGTTVAGQQGLAAEIVKDLKEIVTAIEAAVGGVLAQSLPTVVTVVETEVSDVLDILSDVEAIVFQLVQVLGGLIGSLLSSTEVLVAAELKEVHSLLAPVLTPVLTFVGLVQCDSCGAEGLIQEVAATVGGILGVVNGLLSDLGLTEIDL